MPVPESPTHDMPPASDEPPIFLDAHSLLEEHGTKLLAGLILALVIVVGYAVYAVRRASFDEAAQQRLARTTEPAQLLSVAEVFPGSTAAAQALLLYADHKYEKGENDKALEAYDRFIAQFPDSPYVSNAIMGRGFCLDAMGRTDEALGAFRQVSQGHPNSHRALEAYIYTGQIAEAKGEASAARLEYETARARATQGSPWRQVAEEQLQRLDASALQARP